MKDAAFGVILKGNQIVLTQRRDVPIWVLPGGGIEENESPESACLREIEEETGLKVTLVRKSHELTPINRLGAPTHVFVGETRSTPKASSNESSENKLFWLEELPADLFEPHRLWIQEALSTPTLIRRPLKEVTWANVMRYFIRRPWIVLRALWTRLTQN